MRELKFRVWDPTTKEMLSFADGCFSLEDLMLGCFPDGLLYTYDTDAGQEVLLRDDLVWLQYTGLKDKNRKEIYEGDIWKDDEGYLGRIKDSNYGWIVEDLDSLYDCLSYGNVIGNIYENPELLGDKHDE